MKSNPSTLKKNPPKPHQQPSRPVVIGSLSRKPHLSIPRHSHVLKDIPFLRKLHTLAQQVQQGRQPEHVLYDALKGTTASHIKALSEVSQNLLNRNFPKPNQRLIQKLNPFKKLIRQLASSRINSTQKRHLLLRRTHQRGGFAFLLPLLAPIVGTLISAGLKKVL
jgi:hypothetical protein